MLSTLPLTTSGSIPVLAPALSLGLFGREVFPKPESSASTLIHWREQKTLLRLPSGGPIFFNGAGLQNIDLPRLLRIRPTWPSGNCTLGFKGVYSSSRTVATVHLACDPTTGVRFYPLPSGCSKIMAVSLSCCPAAWEYALYAQHVRRAVSENFRSVSVHRCHEPLFPPVREGRIVLVAKGYRQKPARSLRTEHSSSESLIGALRQIGTEIVRSPKQRPFGKTSEDISFSDLFNINIGCVTGNADYFLLTESQRLAHDLPIAALQPVLSKARHLVKAQIAKADWERLRSADERVWLFSPDASSHQSKAVRKYIRYGEKVCDLEAYKLKHREPWYSVKDIREGTGFLSGMTKLGPWICFRSMRHLAATNTLYVLTAKIKMDADQRAAWALSLLSSPCRQQFKHLARRYPDGLPKLEPHDLYAFRLQPPNQTACASQKYKQAIDLLLSGNEARAVAIADAFMSSKCK